MIGLEPTRTIKEIVVDDYRTAAVFQQYGLDFCCGGGATVERACEKKGINVNDLLTDLHQVLTVPSAGEPRFNLWEPDLLIDYILQNHHSYVRSVLPALLQHAEKVAQVHGTARPSLVDVSEKFAVIANDLTSHMMKEEQILFPYIQRLVQSKREGRLPELPPFGSARNPIRMMEMEHQKAGDEMEEIRELTDNYTPPSDACMTYQVLFKELQEFEQDLHRHVHLENNILFPKAIQFEEMVTSEMVVL